MRDRKPLISAEAIEYTSDTPVFNYDEVRELEAYTTELETRIEAMKCCGNCNNYWNCMQETVMRCDHRSGKLDNWQLAEKRGE